METGQVDANGCQGAKIRFSFCLTGGEQSLRMRMRIHVFHCTHTHTHHHHHYPHHHLLHHHPSPPSSSERGETEADSSGGLGRAEREARPFAFLLGIPQGGDFTQVPRWSQQGVRGAGTEESGEVDSILRGHGLVRRLQCFQRCSTMERATRCLGNCQVKGVIQGDTPDGRKQFMY